LAFSQTNGVFDAVFAVFVEEQLAKRSERNVIENKRFFFILFFYFKPNRFLKPVRFYEL